MSNCIDVVKGEKVVFFPDEIDIEKFKALVDSVANLPKAPEEKDGYYAWWFLQRNSAVDQRGVVIRFGQGRSTHTNRDFDGTLLTLSKFMKKEKYHVFSVTDEGDGHRKVYTQTVKFKDFPKQLEEKEARIKAYVDSLDFSKIKVTGA